MKPVQLLQKEYEQIVQHLKVARVMKNAYPYEALQTILNNAKEYRTAIRKLKEQCH